MNRSPLFPFLLLFGSTIVVCFYSNLHHFLPNWMLFLFMLLLSTFSVVSYKFLNSKLLSYLLLSGFVIVFGTFVMHNSDSGTQSNQSFEEIILKGQISSEPSYKNDKVRFQLETICWMDEGQSQIKRFDEELIVNIKGDKGVYKMGDEILLKGRLSEIKNKGNPGEFDYSTFMRKKGIYHQVFVNDNNCKVVGSVKNSIFVWANRARERMMQLIDNNVDEAEAPIAKAILLGYKNDIDDLTRSHYAASGASHILAVSGMHVGILVLIISYINKLWARTEKLKVLAAVLSLLLVWSFVFLTGFAPSIVRSGFMFSLLLLGNLLQRSPSSLNIITLSAFLLLIIEPLNIFDVGFQLSFAAIFGIFYIYPKFNKRFYIKNRPLRWLYQLSLVSISAQIATLPFTLFYFKQFPSYFLLTNPVSTVGATLILVVGVLFFIFSFSPAILSFLGKLLSLIIEGQNYIMEQVAGFKYSLLKIQGVGLYESLLLVLLVYVLFFVSYQNRKKSFLIKGVIALSIFVGLLAFQKNDSNRMIVFNSKSDNLLLCLDSNDFIYQLDTESKELHAFLENHRNKEVKRLQNQKLSFYHGVIGLGTKKILILDNENADLVNKLDVDLILCTSSGYVPEKIKSDAMWVLPNSLSSKKKRVIEQLLLNNKQTYYDVSKKGAFDLKL